MRQRTLYRTEEYHGKVHLWRLPDLDEPMPQYPGESKDAIIICPIMEGGNNGLIDDHIVRSACWALRSWLKFSDAVDLDIPVRFYVEDSPLIKDTVLEILSENFVPDNQILWYNGSHLDSSKIFSKKHAIYNDEQFAEYKWVYALDADMFLASQSGAKYNFFERLIDRPEEIGLAEIHYNEPYIMMGSKYYEASAKEVIGNDWFGDGDKVSEWLDNVKELTGESVVNVYLNDISKITVTKMPIIAYPARSFLNTRKSDCEWLIKAGNLLGHDEETMSAWEVMGKPLWDISKEVGIPVHWWEGMTMDTDIRNHYLIEHCLASQLCTSLHHVPAHQILSPLPTSTRLP